MEVKHVKSFEFDGKQYEIYSIRDGDRITIKAFVDGSPANGYSYNVDYLTRISFEQKFGYNPVDNLIASAEDDIRNRLWERYVQAVMDARRKDSGEGKS
jgi:hypothetical protein